MVVPNILGLRKYFLGVEIDYPDEFLQNWKDIRGKSSQDRERNFTVYQLIKLHNKIFAGKKTNVIEFGTDLGGGLTTISKFVKSETNVFSVDSFGLHAEEIKKIFLNMINIIKVVISHLQKTRFKNFNHLDMKNSLNKILSEKNSKLETLVGYFPDLRKEDMNKIYDLKFSFVHIDFDLYNSTIDTFNFIKNRLEKNAIILFDDYNLINQEGVKKQLQI